MRHIYKENAEAMTLQKNVRSNAEKHALCEISVHKLEWSELLEEILDHSRSGVQRALVIYF